MMQRQQRRLAGLLVLGIIGLLGVSGCGVFEDAPPTVTPIYITATPAPPVVPVIATETPAVTSVMAATSAVALPTQGAGRTATPSAAPAITMTPSFTPTATDTPVTPGAGFVPVGGSSGGSGSGVTTSGGGASCTNVPGGPFGAIFESDAALQTTLGCPLANAASNVSSAYQPFQNGFMIWVSSLGAQPQSAIYALYNNGSYQRFNDTFTEGVDPASSGAQPPEGVLEPVRGFGKVWRENPTARDTLGWATSGESGGTAQVLLFERGAMLSISQTGQTYVLVTGAPGTWTAR